MKIIFLDDSNIVLETLQMLMDNVTDAIDTFFYKDAKEILKLLELDNLEFDILFSEILFNNLDGMNLITIIKENPKFKDKKVVIITKENDKKKIDALKYLGIKEVFTKSIYSNHLEVFLNNIIRQEMRVL